MSLHAKPHTLGAYVFSCNLPPAPLAEWPGSFRCLLPQHGGGTNTEIESEQDLTLEKKTLPPILEPETFRSPVRCSTTAIPAPQCTRLQSLRGLVAVLPPADDAFVNLNVRYSPWHGWVVSFRVLLGMCSSQSAHFTCRTNTHRSASFIIPIFACRLWIIKSR